MRRRSTGLPALIALLILSSTSPSRSQSGAPAPPPRQEVTPEDQKLIDARPVGGLWDEISAWEQARKLENLARVFAKPDAANWVRYSGEQRTDRELLEYLEAYHPDVARVYRIGFEKGEERREFQKRVQRANPSEDWRALFELSRERVDESYWGVQAVHRVFEAADLPEAREFLRDYIRKGIDGSAYPPERFHHILSHYRICCQAALRSSGTWGREALEEVILANGPSTWTAIEACSQFGDPALRPWLLGLAARADEGVKRSLLLAARMLRRPG